MPAASIRVPSWRLVVLRHLMECAPDFCSANQDTNTVTTDGIRQSLCRGEASAYVMLPRSVSSLSALQKQEHFIGLNYIISDKTQRLGGFLRLTERWSIEPSTHLIILGTRRPLQLDVLC
jgi:hypothetical protein